ncbi:uncharacterized protein LOC115696947 isoform X3 [Cannabis sativa]|uniref:uncharacterized protein LOC115696947 isoform X3 n=1 Tax=Cannabis sativa TaxID=3483 RepID=UPI0011DFCDB2|nr:uncharacterized protein LOC115696947 isoform X3 [Cannabis sativa]
MIFNGFRSVFSPNSKLGVSFLKYSFSATPSLPKVQVFLALRTEALLGDAGYSWPSSGDGLQQVLLADGDRGNNGRPCPPLIYFVLFKICVHMNCLVKSLNNLYVL